MKSTLQVRIDKRTKEKAKKVFDRMGLDMSSGIKLYLNQVITRERIPFNIVTKNGFTSEEEARMRRETDEAMEKGTRYKSVKALHDDIS